MSRIRSAVLDELLRWSMILIVLIVTVYGVVSYSFDAPARQVVDWPAIDSYFRRDFSEAGFAIVCNFGDPRPRCTVRWKPPFDSSAPSITVYRCDDEADQPREVILLRFADQVRKTLDDQARGHALAVLSAFFESGLRQKIDRALNRAREHANYANRLPPFELESANDQNWIVKGVDDTLQAIPTGLPNRPPYLGSVYASWDGSRANSIQVTARSATAESSVWLTPGQQTPCDFLYPGGPDSGNCGSVDILLCNPQSPGCVAESALNVRALGSGSALVMRTSDRAGRLLGRTLEALGVEDQLALQQSTGGRATTLYVDGIDTLPDLTVEVSHETSPPLSRLRLVNGRWTRWFEPSMEPWLVPVVNRMNRYAGAEKRIDPERAITLTVDLELQDKLDRALDDWMREHAEPKLRAHMATHKSKRLSKGSRERDHRRPAPEAGITVLDAATGHILAVASYPPASALIDDDGVPAFGPGWQARLAGPNAKPWAQREIVSALADRLQEDANSNFVRHPIGSTMKPLMLGAVMDDRGGDGLSRLFNLVVAGHRDTAGRTNGGNDKHPKCPDCEDQTFEAIAGMPLGPWGSEEAKGTHADDPWLDRREFLLASCNKYAVTLGVLTLLDWSGTARTQSTACCWIPGRDQFGFSPATGSAAPSDLITEENQLPPLGKWLHRSSYQTHGEFANAPIFKRLEHYYGLKAGSDAQAYDSDPWIACVGMPGLSTTLKSSEFLGRVETTELALTSNRVSTAFTNIFTGGGRNWWTNVKLAEAYARVATNRQIDATFCAPKNAVAPKPLYSNIQRWEELTGILSQQRTAANWVAPHAKKITKWVDAGPPGSRITLSKTGTSLRELGFSSTGIFAMYVGNKPAAAPTGNPLPNGRGFVVIVHIDDIGHSSEAVRLMNDVFPILERRLR